MVLSPLLEYGEVVVKADGRQLAPSEYKIDHDAGTITVRSGVLPADRCCGTYYGKPPTKKHKQAQWKRETAAFGRRK